MDKMIELLGGKEEKDEGRVILPPLSSRHIYHKTKNNILLEGILIKS